jgi:hypothetical protein
LSKSSTTDSFRNGVSKRILSIETPDSLEVSFLSNLSWHFVWEKHGFFLNNFWGHFSDCLVFSSELSSSLFGSGINTKVDWGYLITVGEGIKKFILLVRIEMTLVSVPPWLWYLVVVKS